MPFHRKEKLLVLGAMILLMIIAGCGFYLLEEATTPHVKKETLLMREDNPANYKAVSRILSTLRSGDLALRTGADMTSNLLRQMNRHNKRFSHCGIVVVENGYPFVYHSIGGEDNPDERMRRDSAWAFFTPYSNEGFGIARLPFSEKQTARLCGIVKEYYGAAPLFDMAFDLETDSALYCAEFVYKAVGKAAGDSHYFPLTHSAGRTYVGVDDLYDNERVHLIADVVFR